MLERWFSRIITDLKDHCNITITNLEPLELFSYIYNILNEFIDDFSAESILYIEDLCTIMVNGYSNNELKRCRKVVNKLRKVISPPQRSKEWFSFRRDRITASQIATIVGFGKYSTINSILKDKCGVDKPYFSTMATEHGVKYEEVVTRIYSHREGKIVYEFGCIPHETLKYLGASPDGITEDGIALEIKCPFKRKIINDVPKHYWPQMQLQLEVLDLPECHFIEVKIEEYDDYQEFYEDFDVDPNQSIRENKLEKGMLVKQSITSNKNNYYYIDNYLPINQQVKEANKITDKLCKENNESIINIKYWKVDLYQKQRVFRDPVWFQSILPQLRDFWDKVEHYRKIGIDKLVEKPKKSFFRKKKEIKCLLNFDSDSSDN